MEFQDFLKIFKETSLDIIKNIDKYKVIIYLIYFLFYFILYYIINLSQICEGYNLDFNKTYKIILLCIDLLFLVSFIVFLVYYTKKINNIISLIKLYCVIIPILISGVLIFINTIIFNKYLIPISQSNITKIIFFILSILFYIIFIMLFIYNINDLINIEFFLAISLLVLFFGEYILLSVKGIHKIYYKLKNNDFSTLTINCFKNNFNEHYSNDNNNTNNQLINISKKYGDNYLKTLGNIPISFYNKKLDTYQDLLLCDFYYPGSYYSYLSNSPLNGVPSLESLKITISEFKCRIIHLDIYSDSSDPYDPNANPIIRCENMKSGSSPLNLEETFGIINKWAWINNDPNNLSYPFFLYLNFNFDKDNKEIYLKIYESILKYFSK